MAVRSVALTHLSRNIPDLLNQVRYRQVTLEVMRGNERIAYVSPVASAAGYPIAGLDRFLADLPQLLQGDSAHFLDDMHCGVAEQAVKPDLGFIDKRAAMLSVP